MIHHVSIEASDLAAAGRFYDAVLGALGWRRQLDNESEIAWGIVRPVFFAVAADATADRFGGHFCFAANGLSGVKAAWEGGAANGGTDDGAPGPRPEYGAGYYSAYLLDPDGHRVEIAVQSN